MFWNELAFVSNMGNEDSLRESRLIEMRDALAAELNRIAKTVAQQETYGPALVSGFFHPDLLDQSRYGEYVRNSADRFREFVNIISGLNTLSRTVNLYAPSMSKTMRR